MTDVHPSAGSSSRLPGSSKSNDDKPAVTTPDNDHFEEKGVLELDEEGKKKQMLVVVDKRSGREQLKDVAGGPYTQPRW